MLPVLCVPYDKTMFLLLSWHAEHLTFGVRGIVEYVREPSLPCPCLSFLAPVQAWPASPSSCLQLSRRRSAAHPRLASLEIVALSQHRKPAPVPACPQGVAC